MKEAFYMMKRMQVFFRVTLFFILAFSPQSSVWAKEVAVLSAFEAQYQDILSGEKKSLNFSRAKKGTVIVFVSMVCPCSKAHLPTLREIHQQFAQEGFQFYGIHSNLNEKVEDTKKYFEENPLPFPILQDDNLRLANQTKALKTPHAYIFDSAGKILFRGGIDSAPLPSEKSPAQEHYLKNALNQLSQGLTVSKAEARVLGCAIRD